MPRFIIIAFRKNLIKLISSNFYLKREKSSKKVLFGLKNPDVIL